MSFVAKKDTSIWYLNINNIRGKSLFINISVPIALALIFIQEIIVTDMLLDASLAAFAALLPWLIFELVHIYLLRLFLIKFDRIVVYPCGCIYRIKSKIKKYWHSLTIWLLPSVVLVILPVLLLSLLGITPDNFEASPLITDLCTFSLALAVLNLLPIYPLKTYQLADNLIKNRNQKIRLAKLSFVLALLFFVLMLNTQSVLGGLFSVLILSLASKENADQKTAQALEQLTIREVMIPLSRLVTFSQSCRISEALNIALTSMQSVFPIISNNKFYGAISRENLIKSAATESDNYMAGLTKDETLTSSINTDLPRVYRRMIDSGKNYAAIYENETFVGMLVLENLNENLMVRSFKKQHQESQEDEINL